MEICSTATCTQLAKHFRDVHFGGNWTSVNLKETLEDIDHVRANTKTGNLNTILALLYHIHYYTREVLKVLKGGALDASDKFSWEHPMIETETEWRMLIQKLLEDAESFARQVEQLPEEKLSAPMADPKYGSWHRNILGIIEHTHYHLGQIVLIKKLISNAE
jgi:uncharacterized damage-inducible protein DinB